MVNGNAIKSFFENGGTTQAYMHSFDWGNSAWGLPQDWPVSLKVLVNTMMEARLPMFIAWGNSLNLIYNEAYSLLLGDAHPAAFGCSFKTCQPEVWTLVSSLIDKAWQGEAASCETLKISRRFGGQEVAGWFIFSASPIRNDRGDIAGVYAVLTETSRHMQTVRQLQAADRRKDRFLAMLGHELRNPLAPIRTAIELLAQSGKLNEMQRRAVQIVDRQSFQLVRLVEDLLDVTKIPASKSQHKKELLEISSVIQKARENMEALIWQRGQRLSIDLFQEPLYVQGDRHRLERALTNLLHHASQYTQTGGAIFLNVVKMTGNIIITVCDNGLGIAEDDMPHIFDLLSFSSERQMHGSQDTLGIRLALVKKIVEHHGGTVSALSAGVKQGSEFRITLPLAPEPAAFSPYSPGSILPKSKPRKILVVDDNPDTAEMMKELLSSLGHAVTVALNGEDAIQTAVSIQPHLIFLDIGLPGLNGFDIAGILRELPEMGHTTFIALTGYSREGDKQKTTEAGFRHHLVKPVSVDKISEIIASVAGEAD